MIVSTPGTGHAASGDSGDSGDSGGDDESEDNDDDDDDAGDDDGDGGDDGGGDGGNAGDGGSTSGTYAGASLGALSTAMSRSADVRVFSRLTKISIVYLRERGFINTSHAERRALHTLQIITLARTLKNRLESCK